MMWIVDPGFPCLRDYLATGHIDLGRFLVRTGADFLAGLLFGTCLHWIFNRSGEGPP